MPSKALSSGHPGGREAGSGSHSYGHAVGNPVWGQVVIWQLLVLVALSDHADDGVEVLAESGHGLLHRLLDEMLFWVHTQEQLRNQTQTEMDRLISSGARVTDRPGPTHRAHPLGVTSAACPECPENAKATPNLAFPKEVSGAGGGLQIKGRDNCPTVGWPQ